MSDDHEPQLSNPTKERVKGPVGRRLPTKKAQGVKAITEEADQDQDVSAALREFRTAAKRVREAREADEKDKKYEKDEKAERKHEVNDMSRQGIVDPADFDRAWFFRVPSFSWHNSDTTTAAKRSKSDPTEVFCENNNTVNTCQRVFAGQSSQFKKFPFKMLFYEPFGKHWCPNISFLCSC